MSQRGFYRISFVMTDRQRFDQIFNEYFGLLMFICSKLGLSKEKSEEVVQDSFLKYWEICGTEREPESTKAWLAKIVRNRAIDFLRSAANRTTDSNADPELLGTNTMQENLIRQRQWSFIEAQVETLVGVAGHLEFVRFYYEGLSTDEIAKKAGVSIGTVTSRISRIRQKLLENFRTLSNEKVGCP